MPHPNGMGRSTGRQDVDAVIVGGGVVGLACAAALARRLGSVVLLERHEGPARETSSRNSGVIHAGLYYTPGSLKATLCVEGRERLYRWCEARRVDHRRTGKIVVATTPTEADTLDDIRARALANGAGNIELWNARKVSEREPEVRGTAALWSPESGIVDAHGVAAGLLADARDAGADVVWRTHVRAIEHDGTRWRIETETREGEPFALGASWVVNAAGLEADRVAELAGLDVDRLGWRQHPCKGDYFALGTGAPRTRCALVYPVPQAAGLGVHLTVDLGGRCTAGPDATYVERLDDFRVDEDKAGQFADAVARYLPGVRAEHLSPDYAGIRPKVQAPGEPPRDFVIEHAAEHGAPGFVHLGGIESPGLTAAIAIGERVAQTVQS